MSQMLRVEHFFFECGHFRKIMHTWRASGCLITIYILPEAIHVITIHITIRILLSKCFYPERYWISILLMFGKTPKTRAEALAQTWKLSALRNSQVERPWGEPAERSGWRGYEMSPILEGDQSWCRIYHTQWVWYIYLQFTEEIIQAIGKLISYWWSISGYSSFWGIFSK